jgi:hypothetical protein
MLASQVWLLIYREFHQYDRVHDLKVVELQRRMPQQEERVEE